MAEARRRAEAAYRLALVEARREGLTLQAIAEAAGITRSAVHQILRNAGPFAGRDDAALEARLAVLNGRYEALVDSLAAAEGRPGDYKTETAWRNARRAKLERRGRSVPTVRAELRGIAEAKLLRLLENRRGEPIIDRIVGELDEAHALQQELTFRAEARSGFGHVD